VNGQGAPVSVTIKDLSGAGKVAATMTLDGIDSCITVRDLIRTRVREEVARGAGTSTGSSRPARRFMPLSGTAFSSSWPAGRSPIPVRSSS
jgi:hypothetical protein